jgi:LPS O-antigen subunit length determinant protein (WzzB/FepE family)
MNISQNRKTSFITVSIKHHSPYVAKEWTDIIIQQINNSMRDEEKNRIMKSIEFLNAQALKVNFEEIKEAITFLQQEQIKSLMLIESNENHIFKILNSPIVPELKSEPSRKEIVILGTLLGILISIAFVFITYLFPIKSKD